MLVNVATKHMHIFFLHNITPTGNIISLIINTDCLADASFI